MITDSVHVGDLVLAPGRLDYLLMRVRLVGRINLVLQARPNGFRLQRLMSECFAVPQWIRLGGTVRLPDGNLGVVGGFGVRDDEPYAVVTPCQSPTPLEDTNAYLCSQLEAWFSHDD